MRCLLLFGLLGLSLGMEFDCTSPTGGVNLMGAINNAETLNYHLEVSSSEYTKDSNITVILRGPTIQHFQLQAREPCNVHCERLRPLGRWHHQSFAATCGGRGAAVVSGSNQEMHELIVYWSGPEDEGQMMPVNIVAVVVDNENKVHHNILSTPIYPVIEDDVHNREEEEEEPERVDVEEDEGEYTPPEEEEDDGPVEDPNDAERREKELHDAAVARDLQPEEEEPEERMPGLQDDHGLRREEELAALRREKEREMEELEMNEEGDWGNSEMEEKEREEEEFNREMYEYEKEQAEQEKKRLEMIEWEIRDKEEHDRWLAEQEKNRSPKDGDNDKTPEEEVEINVEEEIIVVEASSGAALISSVLMVAIVAVLAI